MNKNDKEASKAVALALVIGITTFFAIVIALGFGMQAEIANELPNNYCGINTEICDN